MTTAPRAALGSHPPVAAGLACALDTAERIGVGRGPAPDDHRRPPGWLDVYLDALDRHPRARVCLDTPPAFVAGLEAFRELLAHPAVAGLPVLLETPGGVDAYTEHLAVLDGLRP